MYQFFLIFIFFCSCLIEAKIITTPHVVNAVSYIDTESWFLVDLDNTLIDATKTKNGLSIPLEHNFIPTLIELQNQGVTIMALTHRSPYQAPFTFHQLATLGFDFTLTAPSVDTFILPFLNRTPLYKNGILFVSDQNKKGTAFISFLRIIKKCPKKIVFIDDLKHNLQDLEQTLALEGIPYIGIHYTAARTKKRVR